MGGIDKNGGAAFDAVPEAVEDLVAWRVLEVPSQAHIHQYNVHFGNVLMGISWFIARDMCEHGRDMIVTVRNKRAHAHLRPWRKCAREISKLAYSLNHGTACRSPWTSFYRAWTGVDVRRARNY